MKKLLVLLMAAFLLLPGCAKKEATQPIATETPAPTEATEPTAAFYDAYQNATERPIAVMVDNDSKDSWPHAGLQDAYMLYEVPVEGGATRIMALFNQQQTEKIGPVRSSRHYFLDYMLEHDALYVHFGWSPRAMADIPALGVNNINGIYDAGAFWRENKYVGDYHSAFTSMEKIRAMVTDKGYRTERNANPLTYNKMDTPITGSVANTISIPYSGFYSAGFEYDSASATYKRLMNNKPHALQNDGAFAVKNVVIMHVASYPLGDGSARLNLDTVGSGDGYYVTMGQAIPITWEKSARTAATLWKDANGTAIALNPGQTFVMVVPKQIAPVIG